jgi:2-polyprenyl-3-methyl-5-hydroxy-6-metoxy-1,4-benzoquinol methylase
MPAPGAQPGPTPERFFNIINGYQQSAALKAAIELNFFTAIAEGHNTADKAAARCHTSPRGARILADYLTVMGFLQKEGNSYRLAEDAALFLDKNSPAYLGACVEFLLSPHIKGNFDHLTERVRHGGTANAAEDTVLEANNDVWVRFARGMAGLMTMPAKILAQHLLAGAPPAPLKVLDIAAGHGMFGIAVAQQNPQAQVTGLDWANVLAVAKENAAKFGVIARYSSIAGSAFDVSLGSDYDLVLVPNFLHHFDRPTNLALLKRIHAALKPGGRVAILEFAPNDDRISPPPMAAFALVMLAGTPQGDAYTATELTAMLQEAGFKDSTWRDLPNTLQRMIVGQK